MKTKSDNSQYSHCYLKFQKDMIPLVIRMTVKINITMYINLLGRKKTNKGGMNFVNMVLCLKYWAYGV